MKDLKKFLIGLLVFLVLSSSFCWARDLIEIPVKDLNELETTLRTADAQLTVSKQEIMLLKSYQGNLESILTLQDKQITTLKTQLDTALTSLQKSKNATSWNSIKIIVVGALCVAIGGAVGYAIRGIR